MGPSIAQRFVADVLGDRCPTSELMARAAVVSWPEVLEFAGAFLQPMLGLRLRRLPPGAVPESVTVAVSNALRASAAARLAQQSILRQVSASLEAAQIRFMAIKGMALGAYAYPMAAARPMTDIDIVVGEGSLDAAARALGAGGFQIDREYREMFPAKPGEDDGFNARWPAGGLFGLVEVHTRLEPTVEGEATMAHFWDRVQRVDIGGVHVWCLRPGDELLEVCLHLAAGHCFMGAFRWLLDVHMLAATPIDWDSLAQHAGTRQGRWTALCLATSEHVFGTRLPAGVLERLAPGLELAVARDLAAEQLWEQGAYEAPPSVGWILGAPSLWQAIARLATRLSPFRRYATGQFAVEAERPSLSQVPLIYRRVRKDLQGVSRHLGAATSPKEALVALRRTMRRLRRNDRLRELIRA